MPRRKNARRASARRYTIASAGKHLTRSRGFSPSRAFSTRPRTSSSAIPSARPNVVDQYSFFAAGAATQLDLADQPRQSRARASPRCCPYESVRGFHILGSGTLIISARPPACVQRLAARPIVPVVQRGARRRDDRAQTSQDRAVFRRLRPRSGRGIRGGADQLMAPPRLHLDDLGGGCGGGRHRGRRHDLARPSTGAQRGPLRQAAARIWPETAARTVLDVSSSAFFFNHKVNLPAPCRTPSRGAFCTRPVSGLHRHPICPIRLDFRTFVTLPAQDRRLAPGPTYQSSSTAARHCQIIFPEVRLPSCTVPRLRGLSPSFPTPTRPHSGSSSSGVCLTQHLRPCQPTHSAAKPEGIR